MNRLPHWIWQKLTRAGYANLEEVADYCEVRGKRRKYRVGFIPNVGTISYKIIVKRMEEKGLWND